MLDKAEYSAFESTLNSSIVSYRTEYLISTLSESTVPRYIRCNFCLNLRSIHGDKEETVSGCFFSEHNEGDGMKKEVDSTGEVMHI